jgi:AcrR family transcriptional regulator
MPADAQPATTASPKERILVAATKLFAEKGLHGAGIREIARDAGVNVNLIAYHFRTKQELYAQVIEATAHELNSGRNTILEELEHRYAPGLPPVREIMHAFIHPVFALIERDAQAWTDFVRAYLRESGTAVWDDVNSRTLVPVLRRFVTALHRSLPAAKRSDVIFVLELAYHSLEITVEPDAASILGDSLKADRQPKELENQMVSALTAAAARFS